MVCSACWMVRSTARRGDIVPGMPEIRIKFQRMDEEGVPCMRQRGLDLVRWPAAEAK